MTDPALGATLARMTGSTGFAEIPSGRLFYELSGVGSPVVLIHPMTLDHRSFDPQMAALAEHHRVLRYDCRGYGRSSMPGAEPYAHGRDLVALLDAIGIDEPVAIVGVSMGGQIGYETALRSPARVRSIVAIGSVVGGWRFSPRAQAIFAGLSAALAEGGVERARAFWRECALFGHTRENPHARAFVDRMIDEYSGWHWQNQSVVDALEPPMIDRLAELEAPILALVGEHDSEDAKGAAALVAKTARRAEMRVLPGLGHLMNLEAPDLVSRIVLDALRAR